MSLSVFSVYSVQIFFVKIRFYFYSGYLHRKFSSVVPVIHGMQWRQWIWHIYGQILTTPSCVYGRLFTWTRMVDFNALIVWTTFIYIRFSIKSSLWALAAAYSLRNSEEWFGRRYEAVATGHVPRCVLHYLIETPGDFTEGGGSWKHTTLWFPGGSSHYRRWSAILVTTAMTQPPPLFPILPSTSALPLLTRLWGITMGKLWN